MRRAAVLLAADLAALGWLWPNVRAARREVLALPTYPAAHDADQALGTLAAAALWLVLAWLALGLLAAVLVVAPGWAGRAARRAAGLLLPRVLSRLLAGSAGLGVLLAPVAALGQPGGPVPAPPSSTSATTVPTPTWPLGPVVDTPTAPRAVTTPSWPVDTPAAPSEPAAPPAKVRVRPGDSLWLIAGRRLGPSASDAQIAAEWPRWYAANAAVIGDDPSLIRPGEVLAAPATVREEGSR